MNQYELKRIVEAVLFVSEKPMTVKEIWNKLFGPSSGGRDSETKATGEPLNKAQDVANQGSDPEGSAAAEVDSHEESFLDYGVSKDDVYQAICALQSDYEGRGCELKSVASGYRFQVNEDLALWLQRWKAEKPPRYSRAVLETLAIIAYKQPITRAEIEDIRGVAVSSHIVKGLLEREWVRIVGHKEVPGRPALFATTKTFLDYFNVASLEELPTLAEIKELGVKNPHADSDLPAVAELSVEDSPVADDAQAEYTLEEDSVEKQADNTIKNAVECKSSSSEEAARDLMTDVHIGSIFDASPDTAPEAMDSVRAGAETEVETVDVASEELGANSELPDLHAEDAKVLIET